MSKKILEGIVCSVKMDKTVVVKVWRRYMHSRYKKVVVKAKKYYAHALEIYKEGDKVRIRSSAPISATKRWEICTE